MTPLDHHPNAPNMLFLNLGAYGGYLKCSVRRHLFLRASTNGSSGTRRKTNSRRNVLLESLQSPICVFVWMKIPKDDKKDQIAPEYVANDPAFEGHNQRYLERASLGRSACMMCTDCYFRYFLSFRSYASGEHTHSAVDLIGWRTLP
eukprot:2346210-Amphidinium_carterae.1